MDAVFVLMRREYPVKVFRTMEAADEECEKRNSESFKEGKRGAGGYFIEEVEFEETDE